MKKFTVFWGGLICVAIGALFLLAIQGAIYHDCVEGDGPKVLVDAACVVQDTIVDHNEVVLEMYCQDQLTFLRDPKVVVGYLKNPGPLTCTVYKSGKAKCQLRE